jgi:hypothetical protein
MSAPGCTTRTFRESLSLPLTKVGACFVAKTERILTPSAAGAEGPCAGAQTRTVAFNFARAWTRGDIAAVNRLVAAEPHFRWVSAGPPGMRTGNQAFNRRSLAQFIRGRHSQHERLTLTSFKFNGSDLRGTEGFGHFEFEAQRNSDDRPATTEIDRIGKGAIICTLPRPMIAVWSLG